MSHRKSWAGGLRVVLACAVAAVALCVALPTSARAATTITKVDVGNVWKGLVVGQQVAFTGEVNPSSECADQMELTDEGWFVMGLGNYICHAHKPNVVPGAGMVYFYQVSLKAKDGYVFPESRDGLTFVLDGSAVTDVSYWASDDGKSAEVAFYDLQVTPSAEATDENVIRSVELADVRLSYALGDAPVASAIRVGASAGSYQVVDECWTKLGTTEGLIAQQWHSSPQGTVPADKWLSAFDAGDFRYSVGLQALDGKTFASDCAVTVNGEAVDSSGVTVYNDGAALRVVYKTINVAAAAPVTPVPATPSTGDAATGDSGKTQPAASVQAKADEKALPQTGDEGSVLVAGMALVAGCALVAAGRTLARER